MRVELSGLPRDNWEHFLRQRDLEQIISQTPERLRPPVLEVGCGDGYLSGLLRERFGEVVSIDPQPRARVPRLCVARCEALPFPDRSFGFIFSSNVLEHVDDVPASMAELKRVLRDDGLMIHTMPTVTWKLLQFALHPVNVAMHGLLPKLARRRPASSSGNASARAPAAGRVRRPAPAQRGLSTRLRAAAWPPVHGAASSHLDETCRFRQAFWRKRFAEGGLTVVRTRPLYLHSAYRLLPFRVLGWRERISRSGVSSVAAYWVRKPS